MKTRTLAVAVAVAVAVLLVPLANGAAATRDLDRELARILDRHLEARGGASAFETLGTYRATGTMIMNAAMHGGMELQAPFTLEWKRPNRLRFDFSIQGRAVTQATDGETGWTSSALRGPAVPERQTEQRRRELGDFSYFVEGPLVAPSGKGVALSLTGTDDFEGTEVFVVEVTRPDGRTATFLLEAESALPIAVRAERAVAAGSAPITRIFSDYKRVGDILFPHHIQTTNEAGKVLQTFVIETIELGVDLADDRFAIPADEGSGR